MIKDINKLKEILPKVCDKETSQDPNKWTPDNPLYGHCAIISLIAQDIFGGELLRASLEGTVFAHMRSHYWNRLPDGKEEDFTKPQFEENYPKFNGVVVKERSYVLSFPETVKRYELLKSRLERIIK